MLARPKLLRHREPLRPVSAPEGRVFSAGRGIAGQRVEPKEIRRSYDRQTSTTRIIPPIIKNTPDVLYYIYQTTCEDLFSMDC